MIKSIWFYHGPGFKLRLTLFSTFSTYLYAMKWQFFLGFSLAGNLCFAQSNGKWNVDAFCEGAVTHEFSVQEGTWMNLDLSPDGKTLVFDLLGDIYTLPVEGGTATPLRQGMAWEVQPRFSPDGKYIAFTSDAGGGDNIWVMTQDGKLARQITKENFRLLNNPQWSPNGPFIVARKHFTGTRSAGAGEMWMYHVQGGEGVALTKRKNDQQDVNEPHFSPDGKYLYYSEDMYPGGYFQYNKDPNREIYVVKRYEFATGQTEVLLSGPGGAVRPTPSHDGKKLAYVKRVRTKTVLFIHDLETGMDQPLYAALDKDQQEAWALFGAYPSFAWSPKDDFIFIWAAGKIQKIHVATGKSEAVPMTVPVSTTLCPTLKVQQPRIENTFQARALRHTITSPDGEKVVTHAAGKLYISEGKSFRPLTSLPDLAFEPAFSPDGKKIAFVTWDDKEGGAIYRLDLHKPGLSPVKLTTERGIYRTPSFSPDGKQLVYVRESGNQHLGTVVGKKHGIYTMRIDGTEVQFVTKEGEFPRFSHGGKRISYQTGGHLFGALEKGWHSVNLNGLDKQTHFTSKYANSFVPSPDEKWLAFTELYKVYLVPFPKTGKTIELSGNMKTLPVAEVSPQAGIALHWSGDSQSLKWTLGPVLYTTHLSHHFQFLQSLVDTLAPSGTPQMDSLKIRLETPVPHTKLALVGARLITMSAAGVIEDGVILIESNRIKAVGTRASMTIPSDFQIIDLKGKTILPGYVDVHAHTGNFRHGLSPNQQWEYLANLAFGVTTTHDPSANTEMVFAQSEAIRAGNMFGPRLFSTGTILYGADGDFKAVIQSEEDALRAVQRNKAFGAFSVKSYNQPRRDQRQQVMVAARKENMLVVPEGGSHFFHNMTMVADGHTGVEHNIPVAPLYQDVLEFWKRTQTGNTPTLIVNYGGVNGEYYWYQHTAVWEDTLLLKFTPREVVDARARHRTMIPQEEYERGHILVSASCKKLHDAGVPIHMGSHGQMQGVGAHWEIWMLVQGGMLPMEALRAATLQGAAYLGLDHEIGSLEPGKLADLQVLHENPLSNIQHTRALQYVMMDGRMYRIPDLKETFTGKFEPAPMFWERTHGHALLPWQELQHGCSCGKH